MECGPERTRGRTSVVDRRYDRRHDDNTSGNITLSGAAAILILIYRYDAPARRGERLRTRSSEVVMEDDAISVSAVVVTALGIKRDEKALQYAVQRVAADELPPDGPRASMWPLRCRARFRTDGAEKPSRILRKPRR